MSLYHSPELLVSLFQRRSFKVYFGYESMGANDPHGVTLTCERLRREAHTKHFYSFSHDKSIGVKDHKIIAN